MLRDFCKLFRLFSFPQKFSWKFHIFAKIFVKIGVFRFRKNFRENFTIFSRKFHDIFAKIFAQIWVFCLREIFAKIIDFLKNFHENKIFSQNEISWNFAKICPFSHDFGIFAETEKLFSFQPYLWCKKKFGYQYTLKLFKNWSMLPDFSKTFFW
jgi:hypothetical protein